MREEFNLKVTPRKLRLPYFAGEVATWIDAAIQKSGWYHQKIHVLSEMNKTIACTIEKAKKILGYQPGIELKEGMRKSIDWCLKMGYL
jgi:nucleoside-diphosphate-sugar epimerase